MIYLDNAATTRLNPTVLGKMLPYMTDRFFNPSSAYADYNNEIYYAKLKIADLIGAVDPDEIYFTSGGTESNNWILSNFNNVITSEIEHPSILNYKSPFFTRMLIPVNINGFIDMEKAKNIMDQFNIVKEYGGEVLVSVMTENNELGTIQPIKELTGIAHEHDFLFHTDAVQAVGHYPINVKDDNIDFLSGSAHKFGGPKGIGFLYIKNEYKDLIKPYIMGGGQNEGLRSGTYNLPGIVGIGAAAREKLKQTNHRKVFDYKTHLIKLLQDKISDIKFNGCSSMTGILNVTIKDINASQLVAMLAERNIFISAGSACHSGSNEPSHVLKAIGLSDEDARSTIRISLGDNNHYEIDTFVQELSECVKILRCYI